MNKAIITFGAAMLFAFGGATFTSCSGDAADGTEQHTNSDGHNHAEAAEYACPMKCEGDKVYAEAGKCAKCGMDLEVVASHEGHDHDDHEGHDH